MSNNVLNISMYHSAEKKEYWMVTISQTNPFLLNSIQEVQNNIKIQKDKSESITAKIQTHSSQEQNKTKQSIKNKQRNKQRNKQKTKQKTKQKQKQKQNKEQN